MNSDKRNFDPLFKTLLEKRFAALMSPLEAFILKQTTSGILLIVFSAIALGVANSPWRNIAHDIYDTKMGIFLGDFGFSLSLSDWVSQGLMALFFFLTGLEIKREMLAGKLKSYGEISMVVIAALGGIFIPAIFYALVNYGEPGQHGWAIPTTTDTAFVVGILAMITLAIPSYLPLLRHNIL